MEKDREKCLKLAIRIYELDAMVYKASGSDLGRTFSGSKKHNIDELLILIMSNPQGHLYKRFSPNYQLPRKRWLCDDL